MGYVLALAVIGLAIGTRFRVKLLLPILVLLLCGSIVFALVRGFSLPAGALLALLVQMVVQSGYFFGLVTHVAFAAIFRDAPLRRPNAARKVRVEKPG